MSEFFMTVVCIAVFATTMGLVKYSIAPYIAGSYGLVGGVLFVGACYCIAKFIERKKTP